MKADTLEDNMGFVGTSVLLRLGEVHHRRRKELAYLEVMIVYDVYDYYKQSNNSNRTLNILGFCF